MRHHPLTILLTAVIASHALLGGLGGSAVLCLGGGHQHAPAEVDQCELGCSHHSSWPLPVPAHEHEHDCDCSDIELAIAELLNVPRGDDSGYAISDTVPEYSLCAVLVESGLGQRGPPRPPPWFDPGESQRLALVESVRLII